MTEELYILQLSDIHAGKRFEKRSGRSARTENECCKVLFDIIKKELQKEIYPKRFNALVINGDLTDKAAEDEFSAIKMFINELVTTDETKFDIAIAVPGNHDVDWKVARQYHLKGVEKDPLSRFNSSLKGGHFEELPNNHLLTSPLNENDEIIVKEINKPFPCEFVPFNSVSLGGTPDPVVLEALKQKRRGKSDALQPEDWDFVPPIDPGYVLPEYMDRCQQQLNGKKKNNLRIAIIHHNPLPYGGSEFKKYQFVNAGAFNNFLIENNFRIVLHGHQHTSRLLYYCCPDKQSIITPGVLFVGAPACGALDAQRFGINVITIKRCNETAIGFHIRQVSWSDIDDYPTRQEEQEHKLIIPLADLEPSKLKISNHILSADKDVIKHIEKVLVDSDDSEENLHQAPYFIQMHNRRSGLSYVRAMYSVSVFSAQLWSEKQMADMLLAEARRSFARAAALSKVSDFQQLKDNDQNKIESWMKQVTPGLHYQFTSPLYAAIQKAKENSKALQVTSRLWKQREKDREQLRSNIGEQGWNFLNEFVYRIGRVPAYSIEESQSVAVWDNDKKTSELWMEHSATDIPKDKLENILKSIKTTGRIGDMHVTFSELPWTPIAEFSGQEEWLKKVLEFPRILIWKPEEFEDDYALRCIEFHENCGFPLFWLDPDRLREWDSERKDFGKINRLPIGHDTVMALADRDGKPLSNAQSVWSDDKGEKPAFDETRFPENKVDWIWQGLLPKPDFLRKGASFIDEFNLLLGRPDIIFAADAWAMYKLGAEAWQELITVLKDADYNEWYT